MKKSVLLSVFLSFFVFCSYSQYFDWTNGVGGVSSDTSYSVTFDSKGYSYTSGSFSESGDFQSDSLEYILTSAGLEDMFIVKNDSLGKFEWAKSFGGDGIDKIISSSILGSNLFISGVFSNSFTFGSTLVSSNGDLDVFIAKLDLEGDVIWVKTLGGAKSDKLRGMFVSSSGIFISGEFSSNLDGLTGDFSMFVQKRDLDGNVVWTKSFGSNRSVLSNAISVDKNGDVYNIGGLMGANVDFNSSPSKDSLLSTNGLTDIFIQKLNSNGDFVWVRKIGGVAFDEINGISINDTVLYLTGTFQSTVDFNPSTSVSNLTSSGGSDIFILSLGLKGDFYWAKKIGGSKSDVSKAIANDLNSNIYISGSFNGAGAGVDFDPGVNEVKLVSNYNSSFLLKLTSKGDYVYVKQLGDGASNMATAIAVDSAQNTFITGYYTGEVIFSSDSLPVRGLTEVFTCHMLDKPRYDPNDPNMNSLAENNMNVSLYPNPVVSNLFFDLGQLDSDCKVKITDVKGSVLYSYTVLKGLNTGYLNFEEFRTGLYLVTFETKDKNGVYKIYKK
jgi:hypothetical protein